MTHFILGVLVGGCALALASLLPVQTAAPVPHPHTADVRILVPIYSEIGRPLPVQVQ